MSNKKYRLRNLKITRVDQVDAGANQDAWITITKANDSAESKPAATGGTGPARGDADSSGQGEPQAGRKSRLVRFTPEDFKPSASGDSHKEWTIPDDKLPEGIEEISITMFKDGEETRWQWFVDPVEGPPAEGNAKTAADAIMGLRTAATTTGATATAGMKLPEDDGMGSSASTEEGGGDGAGNARSRLQELMASLTKGLVDADIFKSTTTGEDLRDILPQSTLDELSGLLSAKASAKSNQEVTMDLKELGDAVSQEVLDYIEELETENESLTKRLEDVDAPSEEEEVDPIAKALDALPADVAQIIKSQQQELADTKAEIEAERLAKRNEVWVSKARSFDGIVEDPKVFGEKLRQVADSDEELANEIVKALSAAATQEKKSALFKEYGSSSHAEGSVGEKVAQLVKSRTEASDISETEAEAEIFKNNPDLYDEYVAEQRARAERR